MTVPGGLVSGGFAGSALASLSLSAVSAGTEPVMSSLDITGSVPAETADKDKLAKADPAKPPDTKPPGTVILTEPGQPSGAERAILERLQERRQELDTRARELDIRESLIKAAEKRMEGQLT